MYSKKCVKWPLSKRPKIGFQDKLSLNAGQKYCKMLHGEHSVILTTFIKLPFVIKIFVLSMFKWRFYTGFTVYYHSCRVNKTSFIHILNIGSCACMTFQTCLKYVCFLHDNLISLKPLLTKIHVQITNFVCCLNMVLTLKTLKMHSDFFA